MASVKWIKLNVDMFDDEKIKIIQSMPEGDALLIVWVKLILLAGKTNEGGYIYISENMPYTEEMLSVVVNKPLTIIRLAIETFTRLGMIENDEKGIYLVNFEKHQSLDKLEQIREQTRLRVAKHRAKLKENNNVTLQVTQSNAIDKDIDKEEDKDIDIEIYKYIVDYLNQKTGKNFKVNSNKTKSLIKARLNEGFTKEDFVKVIDIKTNEWLKTKMEQYLRPETLFSNKFEGYLNQNSGTPNWLNKDIKAEEISDDELKELEEMMRDFK